ncbi:hypothetical protein V473_19005 [Sphingobium cupriresistens LL01]|uniref:Uncharacterized protein n=1 Tax=Sphingobium cupriresistens LL01 TaxID=1420583 RepID=A0A0J7XNV3_9SPHN|nr:hypothetical protein V473_19005 [Sphingobium cupriresistens LL01]
MTGKTVRTKGERKRIDIGQSYSIGPLAMAIRRESRAGIFRGRQKTRDVASDQFGQVGMNHDETRCPEPKARRSQFAVQSPSFIPHPGAWPVKGSGRRQKAHHPHRFDFRHAINHAPGHIRRQHHPLSRI